MLNTLGIVQVSHDSFRVASHAGRRLGGKSVLEWVVRRATDCQQLDALVVSLVDDAEGRIWGQFAPPDVPIHYSSRPDSLGQCVEALARFPARSLVRICAQNIFLDPVLVDRLVTTATTRVGCDYIGYAGVDGRPATASAKGLFGEWLRADALERADREAHLPADRAEPTRYVYSRPEEFGVLLLPLPTDIDPAGVSGAFDSAEQWELAQTIYDALGPEEWDWTRVVEMVSPGSGRR